MATETEPYVSTLSDEALLSLGSMEGWGPPAVAAARAPAAPAVKAPSAWTGYALAGAAAATAYGLHYLPFPPFLITSETGARRPLSAAILAILVGVLIRNLAPIPGRVVENSKNVVRRLIPLTIVLTGAGLNLVHIASVGVRALTITVICMALAMASAYYFGRFFGLWRRTSLLIGAGTAICGTSAIVAVAPLIDAEEDDIVLSIGTVSLLGLVLMFVAPLAGGLMGLSDQSYAVWAGTSIHAVPQVVAAGFAFSQQAGALATLVKLVRVTLLAPFVFVLAALYAKRQTRRGRVTVHYARLVPPFVWGFVAAALLNTLGLIPALQFQPVAVLGGAVRLPLTDVLATAGNLVLAMAMAALGLEVNLRFLAGVGAKALLTGTAACLLLCGASLALIRLML